MITTPPLRLPSTLNVSFPYINDKALIAKAANVVAASVGSACHAESELISGVLGAMGLSFERAKGAVRLSVGVPTTEEEIKCAASALIAAWKECRQFEVPQLESIG